LRMGPKVVSHQPGEEALKSGTPASSKMRSGGVDTEVETTI
jgi:hypothetical protein